METEEILDNLANITVEFIEYNFRWNKECLTKFDHLYEKAREDLIFFLEAKEGTGDGKINYYETFDYFYDTIKTKPYPPLWNFLMAKTILQIIYENNLFNYDKIKYFLQDNVYTDIQWNNLVRKRLQQYRSKDPNFTYEEAEVLVVMNSCQAIFDSRRVLLAVGEKGLSIAKRIKLYLYIWTEHLINYRNNLHYTIEAVCVMNEPKEIKNAFEKKLAKVIKDTFANIRKQAK